MANNNTQSIRTIALVGHGAAGKTTLAEALLHAAGAIKNKGTVDRGNTVSDFDPQEKAEGHSLYSADTHFEYDNTHVYLLDTPGYPDFAGQAIAALAAVGDRIQPILFTHHKHVVEIARRMNDSDVVIVELN